MSNEANEATRDYFTQSTFTQSTVTQNTLNVPVRLRRRTAAHKAMVSVILSALMILAAACDESGGGSGDGGQSAEAALITQPVDLPPGQTEAELAWEPSVGPVTGYMVFASRNGSTFDFEANASESSAMISGEPGDEVSIVVVALSENGSLSDASPPSAPVRFHAETPSDTVAATDRVIDPASTAVAFTNEQVTNKTIANGPTTGDSAAEIASAGVTAENTSPVELSGDASSEAEALNAAASEPGLEPQVLANREQDDDETSDAELRSALLERLLSSDARLAPRGQSDEADAWVQSIADEELAAGVSFVGTGNANNDALRELVWQDSSGQLFVSDGEAFLGSLDNEGQEAVDTLDEALRLQATERFVAFENLDGNAGSEWLIEDTLSGQVFIASADASSTLDATALEQSSDDLRLVGLGDFDGDDQTDLIWMEVEEGGSLALGTEATDWVPALDAEISVPEDRRSDEILAIADVNGDGRDDLLSRDLDGRLRMTFFVRNESLEQVGTFDAFWAGGADASSTGLELVGTLDLDRDGEAEIAWIDGRDLENGLQIWDASQGLESPVTF